MDDLQASYDVVIIGGAVVGSSVAYWLSANPDFDGSILVIERDPSYRYASTALSGSAIRQQFSEPTNIKMCLFGIHFIKNVADYLTVDNDRPDLGLQEHGYLYLTDAEREPILRTNNATQTELGADIILLDPDQLKARFPWLNTTGISLGSFGQSGEGWFDNMGLLQSFRRKARANGVTYLQDEVVSLERRHDRITEVKLSSGASVACEWAVNAAGPNAGKVAAMAGIELPVEPRKRCIFVFECRENIGTIPLMIEPGGVFCRSEGKNYICGYSPHEVDDPTATDFEVVYAEFEEVVWPTLAERVPAFEAIKQTRAWAGHYDYNTLDQNAIIGRHPKLPNFLLANGFSGHGLQQSPAVGRAISELLVWGEYRSLDVSALSYERVLSNTPVRELNVI